MAARSEAAWDVVVVGAGVFGACTAFWLSRSLGSARTLLVDAWEPGHLRASSSGETRVIRCGYGPRRLYTRWAWEALALWKQWEQAWGTKLFHRVGVLWLFEHEDDYTRDSLVVLAEEEIPVERISLADLPRRFPQFSPEGIGFAYFEPEAGALEARKAVRTVVEAFRQAGGAWQLGQATAPHGKPNERLGEIRLADGTRLAAGHFVFACGPWLPQLFPEPLGTFIRVTRQEVFYFGVPPGDPRFSEGALPAWLAGPYYGVPPVAGRGFKIADTGLGPPFDPTTGERVASTEGATRARDYLALRFPALKYAPLLEARVCQYESTRDANLLLDRHPDWENVWLVGGGSGHGFKLAPKVGKVVAGLLTGETPVPPEELRLRPRPASALENPAY